MENKSKEDVIPDMEDEPREDAVPDTEDKLQGNTLLHLIAALFGAKKISQEYIFEPLSKPVQLAIIALVILFLFFSCYFFCDVFLTKNEDISASIESITELDRDISNFNTRINVLSSYVVQKKITQLNAEIQKANALSKDTFQFHLNIIPLNTLQELMDLSKNTVKKNYEKFKTGELNKYEFDYFFKNEEYYIDSLLTNTQF